MLYSTGYKDTVLVVKNENVILPSIKVKILNENGKMPTKAHDSDAGWDLYAAEDAIIKSGQRCVIKTAISMAIPDGYVGLIWPRSGLAVKQGIDVLAGVVDAGYRGEIMVCLLNTTQELDIGKIDPYDLNVYIKKGDKIAQILFQEVPKFKLHQVAELDNTERAKGGFGSTGK